MRITILFGGTNKERLVSVASAQALHTALPDADLWFWEADDSVHVASGKALLGHARPFEDPFKADGARVSSSIEQAMDRAKEVVTGTDFEKLRTKAAEAASAVYREGHELLTSSEERARAKDQLSESIRKNPLAAVGVAFTAGVVLALLMRG